MQVISNTLGGREGEIEGKPTDGHVSDSDDDMKNDDIKLTDDGIKCDKLREFIIRYNADKRPFIADGSRLRDCMFDNDINDQINIFVVDWAKRFKLTPTQQNRIRNMLKDINGMNTKYKLSDKERNKIEVLNNEMDKANKILDMNDIMMSNIQENTQKCLDNIDTVFDALKDALENKRKALINEAKTHDKNKNNELKDRQKLLKNYCADIQKVY